MGACCSCGVSEHTKHMRKLNTSLSDEAGFGRRVSQYTSKVLLLGTGESGKTTVFKQMQLMYGKGFSGQTRQVYARVVRSCILDTLQTLVMAEGVVVEDQEAKSLFTRHSMNIGKGLAIQGSLLTACQSLWKDKAVQKAFEDRRDDLNLPDNVGLFMDRLTEIGDPDYRLSDEDYLNLRVRTAGMQRETFQISASRQIEVIDVGGQRNERRKWIHQFDAVTAVIFVAAVSEFDQICWEEAGTNRIRESLRLWDEIVNNIPYFRGTNFVLFLNKVDLFRIKFAALQANKFKGVETIEDPNDNKGLKHCFPDWDNSIDDADEALAFIENKFREIYKLPRRTGLSVHATTATATTSMEKVISAVQSSLIQSALGTL